MKVKLEVSMYPLKSKYEKAILNFIQHLESNKKLTVEVNSISTQITGEFQELMATYTEATQMAFEQNETTVFVSKLLHVK